MIATDLVPHRHSVEAAIHLLMGITAVDHRHPVAIALVAMTIVVVHHLHEMITTLVTVVTDLRHLLARLARLLMTLIRHAGGMDVTIRMEHPLPVVGTMIPTVPMGMIDPLDRGLHLLERTGDTMSGHRQDTGDCSLLSCRTPHPKGHLLIMIENHLPFSAEYRSHVYGKCEIQKGGLGNDNWQFAS